VTRSSSFRRRFERALLAVTANQGCRYVVARERSKGELWFVTIDPSGATGGAPLRDQVTGAGSFPYDTWVSAGLLPPGATAVILATSGGVYRTRTRGGAWLGTSSWCNQEMELTVRFISADERVVATNVERVYREAPVRHSAPRGH
jgi:hypothetical protein